MAVPGTEPCILLYPAARWEALAERIAELPEFDAEAQEVRRFYGPDTERLKVDSQWRVVLPGRLKALAGLERGIVTVGAITRCEIWDRSTYAKYHSEIRAPERVARVQQKYRL